MATAAVAMAEVAAMATQSRAMVKTTAVAVAVEGNLTAVAAEGSPVKTKGEVTSKPFSLLLSPVVYCSVESA